MGAETSKPLNEHYVICDYLNKDDASGGNVETFSESEFNSWLSRVKSLSGGYVVVSRLVVKTPLQALKSIGPLLKDVTLSENHGLFHAFIVFNLRDERGRFMSVSFERGQGGILFQAGAKEEDVAYFREGRPRCDVEVLESSLKSGFEGLLVDNLMKVEDLLQSVYGLELGYNLLNRNCQHLRTEFQERIIGLSSRVMLNVR